MSRPRTTSIGMCSAVWLGGSTPASAAQAGAPTYTSDVEPILQRQCVGCHRTGDIAPFSLESYDDARSRGRAIADATARQIHAAVEARARIWRTLRRSARTDATTRSARSRSGWKLECRAARGSARPDAPGGVAARTARPRRHARQPVHASPPTARTSSGISRSRFHWTAREVRRRGGLQSRRTRHPSREHPLDQSAASRELDAEDRTARVRRRHQHGRPLSRRAISWAGRPASRR